MSDKPFSHYLLTRFNVRLEIYGQRTGDWVTDRVRLFERYCLPSVRAQTESDFEWLVFLDADTAPEVRQHLEHLAEGTFTPVFVRGTFDVAHVREAIARTCRAEHVITTRLDNDDAIARDFVETVQTSFDHQSLGFVNLVDGAQLAAGRFYRRPYTQNPFLSLVERRVGTPLRTVFTVRHFAAASVAPVRNVRTGHPMWLQVVHGDNVLNEVVGLRTRAERVAPHFGVDLQDPRADDRYLAERLGGAVRIMGRLARKPTRVLDLGRVLLAPGASRRR